eukprot:gnl/MRDRNA2_/MRDRNA2_207295_c0_seq1.p1 gnl/MRDRNA2_/MRDRNA2_207295_c0~~gnl/MRDRNA2_/MRDRNA2_207295_c0_seq1.p1  ORF type:complete len:534 (-),score=80.86 gnl/MRDRNA2_/MRDRNA2_207295_c0_seq1:36-1580(-)
MFAENGGASMTGGVFLYGFGVLYVVLDLLAAAIIPVISERPWLRNKFMASAMVTWPLGLFALTATVYARSLIGMFAAFVLLAYPMSILCMYVLHIEMPMWWGDETNKASSLNGFAVGGGAVFWTLFLGEMTNAIGKENVTTTLAVTTIVSGVPPLLVLLFYFPPAPDLAVQDKKASQHENIADSGSSKPKKGWLMLLLTDFRVQLYCYVMMAFQFAGFAMKMLLSTIFEEALMLSYIDATRLAAVCLFMYLPGRGLAPLYCSKDRVFTVYLVVLLFEAAAYALTPWAISLGTSGNQSLALGVYTTLRLVSGGGFAVLLGNIGVMAVRVFDMDEFHAVITAFSATEWLAGVGPSVAWVFHVKAREESHSVEDEAHSFDHFFYLCAGVAVSAAICVGCLQRAAGPISKRQSSMVTNCESAELTDKSSGNAVLAIAKNEDTADRVMNLPLTISTRVNALLLDCGLAAQSRDENIISRGRRLAANLDLEFVSVLGLLEKAEILMYGSSITAPSAEADN